MAGRYGYRTRAGSITLELLLVLPLVMFILLACFCFALIERVEHRLIHASAQACRVAAQGGQEEDIRRAIHCCLGSPHLCRLLTVTIQSGCNSGDLCLVKVSVPAKAVAPNLLRCIGFALKDKKLIGQTVMRKE